MTPTKSMEDILNERIEALKEDYSPEKYARIQDMIEINYHSHDPTRYVLLHKLKEAKPK